MKKFVFLVCFASLFIMTGCQKEKLSAILLPGQKLSYSSGDEVITQKIDSVSIKLTPHIYKVNDNERYLVLGLSIENNSKDEISINDSMVTEIFQRTTATKNETMKNVAKEQLEAEMGGKRFWMGVLGAMNRPTTYAEYYAKPITDQQKQIQEKQKDDQDLNNLSDILYADTVESGSSIKRIVLPRISNPGFGESLTNIPHAIYSVSINLDGRKYIFRFKFDEDKPLVVKKEEVKPSEKTSYLNQ